MKAALAENKKTAEFKIFPTPRTASKPTIARAIARTQRRMPGTRMQSWFRKNGVLS